MAWLSPELTTAGAIVDGQIVTHGQDAGTVKFASGPYEALEGADACLVLTEWEDFAALDLGRIKQLLHYPIVVDGRNLFNPTLMEAAGLNYYSVGRPDVVGERAVKASLKAEAAKQNEAA